MASEAHSVLSPPPETLPDGRRYGDSHTGFNHRHCPSLLEQPRRGGGGEGCFTSEKLSFLTHYMKVRRALILSGCHEIKQDNVRKPIGKGAVGGRRAVSKSRGHHPPPARSDHYFTQQIFTEPPLCAWPWAQHWECRVDGDKQGAHFLLEGNEIARRTSK